MENAYVYQHIRLDTNEVFYVGIGTHKYKNDFQCANRLRGWAKNNTQMAYAE